MTTPDLTDEEHAAVVAALRKLIDADKFPLSPRLRPLTSALAKLDPPKPKAPLPKPPEPGDRPRYGPGAKKSRR
jgi:hypothetical protein